MADIDDIIEGGLVFRSAPKGNGGQDGKVKTKAKKKKYITGAHGSGSARQKVTPMLIQKMGTIRQPSGE